MRPRSLLARRLRATAAREDGYVLALAIGILMVLTILTTSIISYSGAGSRQAKLSDSGQTAYALAEAGINNAISVLQKTGTDPAAMGAQPAYAGDPYATVTSYRGGTATWGASYASATRTWTIKSIGSVQNPTGPSTSPLTRTLYANVVIPAPPYSFVALNTSCDGHTLVIRSSGNLDVTSAIYTNSCNDKHDAFDVFGTGGSIASPDIRVVGGWETHDGNPVIVNGVTCPILADNPPSANTPGCPLMGQPVLADPFASVAAPALGATPACPTPTYGGAVSYSPKQTVANGAGITATQTTLQSNGTAIQNGDIIQIETEKLLVLNGGGTVNLTVQRGYLGTKAAAHGKGKEIKKIPVTGYQGTAQNPDQCHVNSGTVTLAPGTYYGGICIGGPTSGADCTPSTCLATKNYSAVSYSPLQKLTAGITATDTTVPTDNLGIADGDVIQIDTELMLVTAGGGTTTLTVTRASNGTTAASHSSGKEIKLVEFFATADVTLSPGTYIISGGGLWLCGNSNLHAPNVLIYNTNDPTSPTSADGGLEPILLNTTGTVELGPQTDGAYAGLTIFQDRNLAVVPGTKCDPRGTDTTIGNEDINFLSMASSGANGALGSVSGTIYAPATNAVFSESVSGRANLAVMASCIAIDGANSIFDYNPGGLFGVGVKVTSQWG